jgi:hypothetical protein
MRALKIAAVSLGLALASPGLAAAQEALAAGAITGAFTGGLVGGPIGAAIGGLAGAALGGAAEAEHGHRQSVRPVAHWGRVQAHSPQRPAEAAPRHTARASSPSRAVRVQPTRVQPTRVRRQELASAVSVTERTCVRDRAGNQTCREVVR